MTDPARDLLGEQVRYYRARAPEYDEWFLRRGRYDRGSEVNAQWFWEVETVRAAVREWTPKGQILEMAAGTGWWTQVLAEKGVGITALDISPETLALNRKRVGDARVSYICADVFEWEAPRKYDGIFFGFWLSHVPPERFESFWNLVRGMLAEGGQVYFLDSRYNPGSTAKDHRLEDRGLAAVTRRLNDGREFRIVKVFYQRDVLTKRLVELGWEFDIRETEQFFIHGMGRAALARL